MLEPSWTYLWAGRLRCAVVISLVTALVDSSFAGSIEPFTEEAQARGLVYVMVDWQQGMGTGQYGYFGYGCGFADLDSDGDPDIVVIGAVDKHVGVFENDGTGHFTDRSESSGIPLFTQASALAMADIVGDSLIDLYLTRVKNNDVLLRNDGAFQFVDVTTSAGVSNSAVGKGACIADYDADGRLDVYVPNQAWPLPQNPSNFLYRNLGDGTFVNTAASLGLDHPGQGFQAVWTDYDLDGDPDLFLSNDNRNPGPYTSNQLWRNDSGQFVNVSAATGVDLSLFSMGVACGDFDGNGWFDLYCTNVVGAFGMNNPLLLNTAGVFVEDGVAAGVDNPFTSWGSIFFDFDNNGHLDLYVNNMNDPNTLYVNSGTLPAVEAAAEANVRASTGISFSSAVADVDNDGDLDLLVNNLGGNVELFINHEGENRNWIKYRIGEEDGGLHAVGAVVNTRTGSTWQIREVLAGGNSYLGQNDMTVHVGLDQATIVDEVTVRWPSGGPTITRTNVIANQTVILLPTETLCGEAPAQENCTDMCTHCDTATGSCAWCVFDLDIDRVIGFGDFGIFAGCFGQCVSSGPCTEFNWDESPDGCIGTGDFAAFAGCFAEHCGGCPNCSGPSAASAASSPSRVAIDIVPVASTIDAGSAARPRGESEFIVEVGSSFDLIVRISVSEGGAGLASAFVDVRFDPSVLRIEQVVAAAPFDILSGGVVDEPAGRVRRVGGLVLGDKRVGVGGSSVVLARLQVRVVGTGMTRVVLEPVVDPIYGVGLVDRFGMLAPEMIDLQGASIRAIKAKRGDNGRSRAGSPR